ncbi:MAG: AlpA family phage regulatory protein [Acidimicrobiaceae bacterium]|nr:AlpA family phage regulatory protein [Acidimicrobiaceae bacterium]
MDIQTAAELSLLTRRQVEERCGIGHSHLYRMIGRDEFPRPVYVGRKSLWRSDEVQAWIEGLPREPNDLGSHSDDGTG